MKTTVKLVNLGFLLNLKYIHNPNIKLIRFLNTKSSSINIPITFSKENSISNTIKKNYKQNVFNYYYFSYIDFNMENFIDFIMANLYLNTTYSILIKFLFLVVTAYFICLVIK